MRTLNPASVAALSGPNPALVLLLEMQYDTPLYVNSSSVNIDWAGHTYLGAGALGAVDAVRDTAGEIASLKFALSGVPSDAIALALGESARNRACLLRLAILHPDTYAVIEAPLIFSGVLDQTAITESGATATVAVTAVHMGALLARRKSLLYTDADQKKLYPADTSLRFVVSQSQKKDVWPAANWKP